MKTKPFLLLLALFGAFLLSAVHAVADQISAGVPVSLSATADGTAPFTYQWAKAGTDIPGATQSTYSIASFAATDAAVYSVKIANSAGSVSTSVPLTLAPPPVVPPSNPKITVIQKVIAWLRSVWAKLFA